MPKFETDPITISGFCPTYFINDEVPESEFTRFELAYAGDEIAKVTFAKQLALNTLEHDLAVLARSILA